MPAQELEAEARRLREDPVAPSDRRKLAVAAGLRLQALEQNLDIRNEDLPGALELDRKRGIDHVGRSEPEVDVTGDRADALGDRRRERDHVVLRHRFVMLHSLGIHAALLDEQLDALLELRPVLARDESFARHTLAHRQLNLEPDAIAIAIAPNG